MSETSSLQRSPTQGAGSKGSHTGSDDAVRPTGDARGRSGARRAGARAAGGRTTVRRARYIWRRMLRLRATPHEVALGCAAGIFAAFTPFVGLQMLLAGVLAFVLRVNIPAALIATWAGNPLSWPIIWASSYVAGSWVLGTDPMLSGGEVTHGANVLGQALKAPSTAALDHAVNALAPLFKPLVIGSLVVGLIAAAGSYYPTRRAVRIFQKRRMIA
ncbi:MAG: DUF2062 domain-containing protein [Hyphomicrobium sp.]